VVGHQNSGFLRTTFLRVSKVTTTGYTLRALHILKKSIAEIFFPVANELNISVYRLNC